jgi:hypothetical protein
MTTGTLTRIFGAAILLIAVQFASVAAKAHTGHPHGHDGHGAQAHALHPHGAVAGAAHSPATEQTGPATRIAPAADRFQPAAQTATAVQNARGTGSDSCVTGCCGTGMGCCGAALATVSPSLPPKAGAPRIGLARLISVREADPRGLRKPPRPLA